MKPKINFVTLAVSNLKESIAFYSKVFHFPVSDQNELLCLFELQDNFYLALQQRSDFLLQTDYTSPQALSAGFILNHRTDSVEAVDEIVKAAETYGAKKIKTLRESWGYAVTFKDSDEHHWEIVYQSDK